MRNAEDDVNTDEVDVEVMRICPFMIMGRSHQSLSEGVPNGAFSGQFSCIGGACMVYVPEYDRCGMAQVITVPIGPDAAPGVLDRVNDVRRSMVEALEALPGEGQAAEDGAEDHVDPAQAPEDV